MAQRRRRSRRRSWLLARLMVKRVSRIGTVFVALFVIVSTAVWLLERNAEGTQVSSLWDSVWLSICTVSTVGYGDTYPVTVAGRAVVGAFILFTLTTIGFLLTAISEAVIEVKKMEEKGLIGTEMSDHIIVCGFSPVARTAIEELLAANLDVAVITEREEDLAVAQRYGPRPNLFTTSGDLLQEVFRDRLNAPEASTAVVATEDDTANIIAALNLRAINSKIRIVAAVKTEALRQTLIANGVTYVSSPFELSGRLVASAAFEPEVAKFVDDITSGVDGWDLQQYSAEPFAGKTVGEIRKELTELDGPLLIGVACAGTGDDSFDIEPHPRADLKLTAEDQLIVVANEEHAKLMLENYSVRQGR